MKIPIIRNSFTPVFLILFVLLSFTDGIAGIKKNVLILHSYHYGMNWTQTIISGMEKEFKEAESKGIQIDATYEFMDTKKYSSKEYLELLHNIYKSKYTKNNFDVIIASDDAALNFLIKYRDEIFGKIPVIFTGINFFSNELISHTWGYTGVVEEADVTGTIDIALKLHPETKKIIVIGDQTLTSVMDRKTIKKTIPKYPGIEFQFLEDGNVFYYQRFLQNLPKNSLILAMHVNTDHQGKYYSYEDSFDIYTLHVKTPIYTFWDFYLNRGTIGGMIVSGDAQGAEAAKKALQVLQGQPIDTIPILKESPNQYIFDYKMLKKFNISSRDLPSDSIIINKPRGFKELYNENKQAIITVMLIIVLLTAIIIVLILNIIKRKKVEKHLVVTNAAYQRFVPSEFLHYLGKKDITKVELGDQIQQDMSVLFSDIRSFTSISEKMSPKETFNFINQYLGVISPIIREYNGFIDKYIGDAIMAIFPSKPEDSIKAAIEMQKNLIDYNIILKKEQKPPIHIGVGIHSGLLMLGTVGESKRMEGTVISDTVNLSSRLEGLTKYFNANIIVSEDVISKTGENAIKYNTRFLGKVKVKGKSIPVGIHQIIDGNENTVIEKLLKTKKLFEQGINHYFNKEYLTAIDRFEKVLKINPDDCAAIHYLETIKEYMDKGFPDNWTGALDMRFK